MVFQEVLGGVLVGRSVIGKWGCQFVNIYPRTGRSVIGRSVIGKRGYQVSAAVWTEFTGVLSSTDHRLPITDYLPYWLKEKAPIIRSPLLYKVVQTIHFSSLSKKPLSFLS